NLVFFCEQKGSLENFIFRRNIAYLHFSDQQSPNNWKPKLIALKEILEKLGLSNIRFALKQKDKEKSATNDNNSSERIAVDSKSNRTKLERKKNDFNSLNSPLINNKKK